MGNGLTEPRPWRCKNFRNCKTEAPPSDDGTIPEGWIGVTQYPGDRAERPKRIGIFHNVGCMLQGVEDMVRDGQIT